MWDICHLIETADDQLDICVEQAVRQFCRCGLGRVAQPGAATTTQGGRREGRWAKLRAGRVPPRGRDERCAKRGFVGAEKMVGDQDEGSFIAPQGCG